MVERIVVSETLAVFIQSGADSVVWIDRTNGGLVAVSPDELKALVEALAEAAARLAEAEAQRSARSSGRAMERQRLRRRRVGKE